MKKTAFVILALVILTLFMRTGNFNKVFAPEGTLYLGVDPWYYARLVDYSVGNSGDILTVDPYDAYPDGKQVVNRPLLVWLASLPTIWFGLDHEAVAAWVPVIVAALITVLVYLLGRTIFHSQFVGIGAALLVIILPTELFNRTMLGFLDHHCLEVLFSLAVILFLHLAMSRRWEWVVGASASHILLYLSWHGAGLLLGVTTLWFAVSYLYRHFTEQDKWRTWHTFGVYLGLMVMPLIMLFPLINAPSLDYYEIAGAALVAFGMFFFGFKGKRGYFVLSTTAVCALVAVILLRDNPVVVQAITQLKSVFWGFGSSIMEAQPTTMAHAWNNYGVVLLIAPFGFYYAARKQVSGIFLVWAVCMAVASFGQRRWGYYFVIPLSLLSCYAVYLFADIVLPKARMSLYTVCILGMSLVLLGGTMETRVLGPAANAPLINACNWLREQTPEPFDSENAYYQTYSQPRYGVLSWWDYGHWLIRIGRRPVVSSPTYQDTAVQKYLTAQTNEEAEQYIDGLNIRYVFVTYSMVQDKFLPIAERLEVLPDEGIELMHDQAQAVRLWNNELPDGYTLVFADAYIKIFERDADATN